VDRVCWDAMPTQWSDNILVAELADEPALSEELNTLLERLEAEADRIPHVVLNFSEVTYLNSSNIAQLLRLRSRAIEGERTMKLCSVRDEVWTLLLATGLQKLFEFAPDPMTALASIQLEGPDGG
jgi:anti-anti-sigma factor